MDPEDERRERRRERRKIKTDHKLGFRAQNPARHKLKRDDKCNTKEHQDFLNANE